MNFQDCYATSKTTPQADEHQDWFLVDANQIDGYTLLKIKRKLQTCDKYDQDIRDGSTFMIFAWNNEDPRNDLNWQYHGFNRRIKTALLLDFKEHNINEQDSILPADTFTYDVIPTRVII